MVTFEGISRDWDRVSKIRARQSTRIYLLYNCISLLFGLGEACEHQVVPPKPPQSTRAAPVLAGRLIPTLGRVMVLRVLTPPSAIRTYFLDLNYTPKTAK